MTHQRAIQGFTLIELLVALVVMTILTVGTIGGLSKLSRHYQRTTTLQRLISGLHLAKTVAITRQSIVTVCPLNATKHCAKDWTLPIAVFLDSSNYRRLTTPSNLLRILSPPEHALLIAKPARKAYFQFEASGMTNGTPGHISYCPDNSSVEAIKLVISRVGRLRLGTAPPMDC